MNQLRLSRLDELVTRMWGTYQIVHPTFFSRESWLLILYVFLNVCHAAPRSGSPVKNRSTKSNLLAKTARFWTSVGALNGTIEPDTNQLGHFCVDDEIMLIMGEQLENF